MMMRNYVVYKITNEINGKIYIGMTNNIKRRWRYEGIEYRPPLKSDRRRPFWNAIQKYGWDNFTKEVIISDLTKEEAFDKEKQMIKRFKATDRSIGYNLSQGGNGGIIYLTHPRGMLGKHHTIENNIRHKKFMSDRNNNPMFNGKTIWGVTHPHPKGMKGKKHSEEVKKRIAETSKKNCSNKKKVEMTLPNGEVNVFESLTECASWLGFSSSSSFIRRLIKTNEPYKLHPNTRSNREKFKSLEGLTLKYLDNTEVTNDSKIS
ncbi:GIY-YIG nuclease family protein [Staphylococcus saprophyticus]|uniref:GIY-YIG nuclease family protein n=1 Tax=Staphylococcus saprophyticus TaxID=29385 RepID=UPI0013E97F6F|nr:GIY-YIG nuclease family protein [Staphylococcus saprophyticus]